MMYEKDDLFTTDGKDVWMISEMYLDEQSRRPVPGKYECAVDQNLLLRNMKNNFFVRGVMGKGDLENFKRLVPDPIIIIREETPEEFSDKMVDFIVEFHKLGALQRQEIFQKVAKRFIGETPEGMEEAFKKGQQKGQDRNNN